MYPERKKGDCTLRERIGGVPRDKRGEVYPERRESKCTQRERRGIVP